MTQKAKNFRNSTVMGFSAIALITMKNLFLPHPKVSSPTSAAQIGDPVQLRAQLLQGPRSALRFAAFVGDDRLGVL